MNIDDVMNPGQPTKQQRDAVLLAVEAVASAIQALGTVPSGELYARVMNHLTLQQYEGIVRALKAAKLVDEKNHLLRWIGPQA